MTASAIMLGLLPIMWSQGTGADVMKRIAALMIGGMVTTTVLTLLILPALYSIWNNGVTNQPDLKPIESFSLSYLQAPLSGR